MANLIPHPSVTFDPQRVYRQAFPFPDSIMQCIKNARTTPKRYTTLLKTCKFFYSRKNLTIPFKQYYYTSHGTVETEVFGSQRLTFSRLEDIPNNLWMLGKIKIHAIPQDFASNFFQKISISAIERLKLMEQIITLDELKFLNSDKLELVNFDRVTILDQKKSIVPLETVVKTIVNVNEIMITLNEESFKSVTAKTAEKVGELVCASKFGSFVLDNLPDTFNFDVFSKIAPKLEIYQTVNLAFSDSISLEYIQNLDAYVDKAIESGITDVAPIYVVYPEQTDERWDGLANLIDAIYRKKMGES